MFHSDALSLLWRVLLCLVLTFVPCFAVCALAIRTGATRAIWLYFLALAEIGAAGWLAFWCWFAAPWLGHLFSFCLPIASAIYLALALRWFNTEQRKLLSALLWPTALTAAAALIVLSAGFLYGGLETPFSTAANRFSHPLPADNQLPYLLAKAMQHARPPIPFFGDWLSSDRPPLQTGISLSEFAYIRRSPMHQILSTISQSLWIFALYPFLCALRIEFRAIRLVLFVCLFSGFVLVNSFFVWPKLIAAAYMLAFSALLLSPPLWNEMKASNAKSVLGGALLAFAMLSHGGAAFSVIGLAFTVLVLRSRAIFHRKLLVVLLSFFCFYLPWILYQKIYDPPGDRLLKWHLAGFTHPTPRSFPQVLTKAYGDLSYRQILDTKLHNFTIVFNPGQGYWAEMDALLSHAVKRTPRDQKDAAESARNIRVLSFFRFAPSLGLLAFGPLALLGWFAINHRRNRSSQNQAALGAATLYVYLVLTLIVWCLLIFLRDGTIIHQGSYAANLTAITAGVLAFWAVAPWLGGAVAAFQIAMTLVLYGVYMNPAPLANSIHWDMFVLWIASLLAAAVTLYRLRSNYNLLIT